MMIGEDSRIPENLRGGKESVRITSPDQYFSEDTSESSRAGKDSRTEDSWTTPYFVNGL